MGRRADRRVQSDTTNYCIEKSPDSATPQGLFDLSSAPLPVSGAGSVCDLGAPVLEWNCQVDAPRFAAFPAIVLLFSLSWDFRPRHGNSLLFKRQKLGTTMFFETSLSPLPGRRDPRPLTPSIVAKGHSFPFFYTVSRFFPNPPLPVSSTAFEDNDVPPLADPVGITDSFFPFSYFFC